MRKPSMGNPYDDIGGRFLIAHRPVGLGGWPAGREPRRMSRLDSNASQGTREPIERRTDMATVSVRYIVDNVEAAMAFYTQHIGFSVDLHPAPGFAALSRGDLRLL